LPGYGETVFSEYVAYVGWAGLILALAGARRGRGSRAWRVGIGLAVAGLLLAFGGYNPAYYVLYRLVPGFGLFRAPARWLILYALGMALLAGAGLERWPERPSATLRDWFSRRRRLAFILLAAGGAACLAIGLLLWRGWLERPSLLSVAGWAVALALLAGLAALGRRLPVAASRAALAGILLLELWLAGRALALASPTAWDAYAALRTAPAHILAAGLQVGSDGRPLDDGAAPASLGDDTAHWGVGAPTFRFISMSDIRYDPGDLADIRALYGRRLSEKALYDFVVAAKEKEVLAPNLPLLYRIASLDGYDGGVLPLKRYVTLQSLLLSPEQILPDGRLREQLREVPPARVLSLLNVEYIITDKVQDVWLNDVFYDLQFKAVLGEDGAGQVVVENPYVFYATALGIVSHLESAGDLPDGAPLATVEWRDAAGRAHELTLRAGQDTAEGAYGAGVAHRPAQPGPSWPEGAGRDYVSVLPIGEAQQPGELTIRWIGAHGRLVLRGITLIDQRTGANRSLVVSGGGRFRLAHSGDVKIYRNLDNLPRAYLVGKARLVPDDTEAIATMRRPAFDPRREVIVHDGSANDYGWDGPGQVEIVSYAAEEIVLRSEAGAPGYLVLSDAWYPGWVAYLDGRPAPVRRANVMFRCVEVPAGQHEVRFCYEPAWLRPAAVISLAGLALLLGLIVAAGVMILRRQSD